LPVLPEYFIDKYFDRPQYLDVAWKRFHLIGTEMETGCSNAPVTLALCSALSLVEKRPCLAVPSRDGEDLFQGVQAGARANISFGQAGRAGVFARRCGIVSNASPAGSMAGERQKWWQTRPQAGGWCE
jgi:hypothetical protein